MTEPRVIDTFNEDEVLKDFLAMIAWFEEQVKAIDTSRQRRKEAGCQQSHT